MADTTHNIGSRDKADRALTVASGWAALVLGTLGLHRWIFLLSFDWWARAGVILGFGLGVMWAWGFWPEITSRLRNWVRGGGLNTTLVAVGLIVCLIVVNTLVRRRLPAKWDLTQNQRYSLAPRSREILKSLTKPVKATVFITTGHRTLGQARDLLNQFQEAGGGKFTWTHVDPLINPEQMLQKGVGLSAEPTALFEYEGKQPQKLTDFTEKEVSGAILKLTRNTSRKLYFLEGHGEMSTEAAPGGASPRSLGMLTQDLKSVQWQVEKLNLYGKNVKTPEPADAAAIVIAGPRREFTGDESKRLNEYLNKGGRVLLLLDADGPAYAGFLKPWGIVTTNDIVLDRRAGQGLVVVEQGEQHPAVKNIGRVLMVSVRSVKPASPAPAGITVTELIKSGDSAVTVPNFMPGKPLSLEGSKDGVVSLAVLAEKTIGTGENAPKARIVVVGDSDFATDTLAQYPVDNQALASALINYLGEEEALVAIPPKDENTEQAFVTPDQGRLLSLIHYLDFPLLALLLAIVVYLKRR
jgi:gliding motility-associatede transport system auxiliary component